jgi:signal transduction histidine kinase
VTKKQDFERRIMPGADNRDSGNRKMQWSGSMIRNMKLTVMVVTAALAIGGCTGPQSQPSAVATGMEDNSATERFSDPAVRGRTTVESALELSEKYAKLSDQAVVLREENQRLAGENQELRRQIADLEAKLKQTQKELSEANALLLEMLRELNNWKNNILGFRSEMREAARAQLEAMLKVLEILGGKAEASALERRHADTLNPAPADAPQPDQPSTPVKDEPNASQQ